MNIPRHIAQILASWNDQLNAAKISNEDAILTAGAMMGFVIINTTADATNVGPETEREAHAVADAMISDLHTFIAENYQIIINNRQTIQ